MSIYLESTKIKVLSKNHLIIKEIKKSTNLSIVGLARTYRLNRMIIYRSINGDGSRRVRVLLAKIIGKKPSEIWQKQGERRKKRDDIIYELDADIEYRGSYE